MRIELTKKDQRSDEQPAPKFKIIDRRRREDSEEPEPAPPTPPAPPDKQKEPDKAGPDHAGEPIQAQQSSEKEYEPQQDMHEDPLGFRNVALSFLQTLSTISWVHMGLVPHPQTQLVAKKMEEARRTIALFEIIFNQVKPDLPAEVNAELVGLIRDLKAGYVSQL